jgi:hypothetical protein
VRLGQAACRRIRLEISGSGEIEADGRCDSLEIEIPGSGEASLLALHTLDARAGISGSGKISLWASRSLDASIDGSGAIVYDGDPQRLMRDISGGGSIDPR